MSALEIVREKVPPGGRSIIIDGCLMAHKGHILDRQFPGPQLGFGDLWML